ncbi:MAG: L-2-amino-thiazoline-4-carboxylic acid hydrolase [Candidatus Odinarchaeota archaeon]
MNSSLTENYYVHTKKHWMKFISGFLDNKKLEREVFQKYIDASKLPGFKLKVQQEFESLLPQLPEPSIKKNNMFTTDMVKFAFSLAFYRVLKEEGFGLEQIGQIIFEACDAYYMAMSPITKRIMRWYYLFYPKQRMKKKIEKYAKIATPDESHVEFVDGDGKNLLFGVNYTECAGLKFLKKHNAVELAPYLCPCDYPMYKAISIGFNRAQNLALGGNMCEFRFYKSYPVPPLDWPLVHVNEYKDFFAEKQNI